MSTVSQLRANLLLCDAAQVVNGKLYILGGGWNNYYVVPGGAVAFAAAIDLIVPWELTNRKLNLAIELLTEDREEVPHPESNEPIKATGELVVGRPPEARAGADLHTSHALPFGPFPLAQGGYVCCLSVDGDVVNTVDFQVIDLPGNPLGGPA